MEIKLTIEATSLPLSTFAEILAGLQGNPSVTITQNLPTPLPAMPEPIAQPHIPPVQTSAPIVPPAAIPTAAPTTVPTTIPQYTMEQLSHAGAMLLDVDSSNLARLQAVLRERFGVATLLELPQEQYPEYASVLRGMGGKL